jgi:hypothetical protein
MTDIPEPPFLWGEWRCNENPRFYTSWCPACGADLWLNWTGAHWQAACMHPERACARDEIELASARLLDDQRLRRLPMDTDDPLYGITAETYIGRLTGQEPDRHFFKCPFHSDEDERTPSLHATGIWWYCHGCGEGGSAYDFAARKWGIEPRGEGFKEIRSRLAQTLLGVT